MSRRLPAPNNQELQALLDEYGQGVWVELTRRYGKTFRASGMVMTCEPEAVRALLLERPHTERRPLALRMMGLLPGFKGVLFMDGEPWLTRARALAAPFHRQTVEGHAAMVHGATVAHVERWLAAGRDEDLYHAVQRLGADTVLRMGYGLDPADPLARALADTLVSNKRRLMSPVPQERIDTLTAGPMLLIRLPMMIAKLWLRHRPVHRAVRRLAAAARYAANPPNWFQRLVEAGLNERDLAFEINHLYTAFNAIDYVLTEALCELARRPALAAAMRAELLSALGDREPPAREDLAALPLMRGFTLEILRRYPVSMSIVRQTGTAMEIGGYHVPAGSQVAILLHALHHHPDFWDDPEELKPERWADDGAPKVPYSYVPFLLGPRKCMGRDMAEQQLLIVLAAIVRRVDLQLLGDSVVPPFMIPRFAGAIPFRATASSAVGRAVSGSPVRT